MANRFELDTTFSLVNENDDNISLPDHENIVAESSPRRQRNNGHQQRTEAGNGTQAAPRAKNGISLMDVQRMIDINNQRLTGQIEQLTNLVRTLTERDMRHHAEESVPVRNRFPVTHSDMVTGINPLNPVAPEPHYQQPSNSQPRDEYRPPSRNRDIPD